MGFSLTLVFWVMGLVIGFGCSLLLGFYFCFLVLIMGNGVMSRM